MSTVLKTGATCWRIERAARFGLLIDNESYFAAVLSSLEQAQRSVVLVGWQFDPRTALLRGSGTEMHESRLGDVLRNLADRRPHLDIRLLVWDMSLLISLRSALYPRRARAWFDGRVELLLDDRHPLGACRHQKLVIIDGSVAFCGGTDFAVNRWDSSAHLDSDRRRKLPSGVIYVARHAASAVVDGLAARALFDLVAARWRHVSGDHMLVPDAASIPWPENVSPLVYDIDVGIARTEPSGHCWPAVREIEHLYVRCIAAARRIIYIEDQYFASARIADALAARLSERLGPEIIVICSEHGASMFDRFFMDPPKAAMLERLHECDPYGRLGVYAPRTVGGHRIVMHSKLMAVDNRLLRIGSANLSNRSLGFDSESDLVIDAHAMPVGRRGEIERSLERLRHVLIAHHLGSSEIEFQARAARSGSSLAAIRELIVSGHANVREIRPKPLGLIRSFLAYYHIGDPRSAADAWRPWRRDDAA